MNQCIHAYPVMGVLLTDFSVLRLRRARDAFSDNFIPNSSRLHTLGNENRGPIAYTNE